MFPRNHVFAKHLVRLMELRETCLRSFPVLTEELSVFMGESDYCQKQSWFIVSNHWHQYSLSNLQHSPMFPTFSQEPTSTPTCAPVSNPLFSSIVDSEYLKSCCCLFLPACYDFLPAFLNVLSSCFALLALFVRPNRLAVDRPCFELLTHLASTSPGCASESFTCLTEHLQAAVSEVNQTGGCQMQRLRCSR